MPLTSKFCVNAAACYAVLSTAAILPPAPNSKTKLLPFPFHEPRGFHAHEHFEDTYVDTDEKFRDRCFTFVDEVFPGKTKAAEMTSKDDAMELEDRLLPLCKDASEPRCSIWARDLASTRDPEQHKEWCDEMLLVSKEWQSTGIPTPRRKPWRAVHAKLTGVGEVPHSTVAPGPTLSPVAVAKRAELQAVNLDAVSKQLDAVAQSQARRKVKKAAKGATAKTSVPTITAAPAATVAPVATTTPVSEVPAEAAAKNASGLQGNAAAETSAEKYVAAAPVITTTPSALEVDSSLDALDHDLGSLGHKLAKTKVRGQAAIPQEAKLPAAPQSEVAVPILQNVSSKVAVERVPLKFDKVHHGNAKPAKATEEPAKVTVTPAKVTAAPDVDHDLDAMDHLLDGVHTNLKKVNSKKSRYHKEPLPLKRAPKPIAAKVATAASTTALPGKATTVSPTHDKLASAEVPARVTVAPAKVTAAPDVDHDLEAMDHLLDDVHTDLKKVNSKKSRYHKEPLPLTLAPEPIAAKDATAASTTALPGKVTTVSPTLDKRPSELKSISGKAVEDQNKFLSHVKAPDVEKDLDAVSRDLEIVDHQLHSATKRKPASQAEVPQLKATKAASPERSVSRASAPSVAAAAAHVLASSVADQLKSKTGGRFVTPLQPQAEPHADMSSAASKEDRRGTCECNVSEGHKICHCREGDQVWTTSEQEPNKVLAPQAIATHAAVETSWFSSLFR